MGLRRGEIIGLRWSDLDLENRVLYVRQQTQRRGGVLYDDRPSAAVASSTTTGARGPLVRCGVPAGVPTGRGGQPQPGTGVPAQLSGTLLRTLERSSVTEPPLLKMPPPLPEPPFEVLRSTAEFLSVSVPPLS